MRPPTWNADSTLGAALRVALVLVGLWSLAAGAAPEDFPVPPALRDDVDFWKRIYAEVDSDAGLLHDERQPSIVYERIDFADGTPSAGRQARVDARKAYYRQILRALATDPEPTDAEARRVRALWPGPATPAEFRRAAGRLRFQLGQADQFRRGLRRAGPFLPYIRGVLAEQGLPRELEVLPQVESSYNHLARSRIGAAGMWQFTRTTGRRYLRIDRIVDERLDPFRSTEAAASLLKQNHKLTGNWPLAVTAYNHGVAGIRRAVRQLDSDRIEDLVQDYRSRRFGFASRNFYVAFAAAVEVWQAALEDEDPARPQSAGGVIEMRGFVDAERVARALALDIEALRDLNPALRGVVWEGRKRIPRGFRLRVPAQFDADAGQQRLATIEADHWHASQHLDRTHRVRRGQTLSGIAAEYGLSQGELARYNAIGNRDFIRVGQVLQLPVREPAAPATPARNGVQHQPVPESGRYRVRRGDSLWLIARRFDLSTSELVELNGLDDADRLHPGDDLLLRDTAIEAAAATEDKDAPSEQLAGTTTPAPDLGASVVSLDDPTDYSVAADGSIEVQVLETLGHYAHWASTRVERLRALNGPRTDRLLVVGRRLQLGLAGAAAETFERRRAAFHRRVQAGFFSRFEVTGTREHLVREGDSLWVLAEQHYRLPVWLLRQFNPDVHPDRVRTGVRLVIPQVSRRQQEDSADAGDPGSGRG